LYLQVITPCLAHYYKKQGCRMAALFTLLALYNTQLQRFDQGLKLT
jgi:hypothetical protein